jgi:hypothetical protein
VSSGVQPVDTPEVAEHTAAFVALGVRPRAMRAATRANVALDDDHGGRAATLRQLRFAQQPTRCASPIGRQATRLYCLTEQLTRSYWGGSSFVRGANGAADR